MVDWAQLRDIISEPDNVAIAGLLGAVVFFAAYGFRQARANDRLLSRLHTGPPAQRPPSPQPERLPVWPYLLKLEFLAAIVVTVLLLVWSLAIDAPLEAPANPNQTMNPAKAPWYFVGLQELLVYFDPWFAGVVLPLLIVIGLMLFPYLDVNPLGSGYYTIRQRRVALTAFFTGLSIWIGAILVGAFIRGPGWIWFWPGQTWDHARAAYENTRDLPDLLTIHNAWGRAFVGLAALALFYSAAAWLLQKLVTRSPADRDTYAHTSRIQYVIFQFFAITILFGVPAKIVLRLLFRIKYVLVTGWFNI